MQEPFSTVNLCLSEAPTSVPNEELWRNGIAGDPEVGDLWLLSWDHEARGLVMLTSIAETYVMGWPVTLSSELAFAPAACANSPLGDRVAYWPTRETGIGMHLLHRRYGRLLDIRQVEKITAAIDNDLKPPITFAPTARDTTQAIKHGERMADEWEAICFHQWPQPIPGEMPLNHDVLVDLSIAPSEIATKLSVSAVIAGTLHKGTRTPSEEQVKVLAQSRSVDPELLVSPSMDTGTRLLSHPSWKDKVLHASKVRSMSEAQSRTKIQEGYALAARSNGSEADRLLAAISRFEAG